MVFVETSFPRGGVVKPTAAESSSSAQPEIVSKFSINSTKIINYFFVVAHQEFGASTFKKRKEKLNKRQRDDKRIQENEEKEERIEAVSAELLNIRTITEGMLIMGAITKIEATHLLVSLPGHLTGSVLVTAISKPYVDIVNRYVHEAVDDNVQGYKTLEQMFRLGQIVCVRVMEIQTGTTSSAEAGNSKLNIVLSMNPVDLQTEFHHNTVSKDAILVAAIESIEDHGYALDTGIKNLRGFLPSSSADDDGVKDFGVGEIVFCKVSKVTKAQAASTIICQAIDTLDDRRVKATADANLSHILPSSIVDFKITKVLVDGAQGTIMNETFTAYVNEHQLGTVAASPDQLEVDAVVEARILYVMPLTKLVYLSLNLCESFRMGGVGDDSKLRIGTIIERARVTRIGTGGLIMKLGEHDKGLISFKSLRIGYSRNFDQDELMAKYHKNSYHRVRVTGYDALDSLFICTNNEEVIKEKFYTINDVQVADYVDAKIIHSLDDGGFFVRVGHIKGQF